MSIINNVIIILSICELTDYSVAAYAATLLCKLPNGGMHVKQISEGYAFDTTNRVTLIGAAAALKQLTKFSCNVTIASNAYYLTHNQAFLSQWQENAKKYSQYPEIWLRTAERTNKRKDGTTTKKIRVVGQVANQDLWERILSASKNHKVTYTLAFESSWLKYKKATDALARQTAWKTVNRMRGF